MSKKDSYTTDSQFPRWENYEVMRFKTSAEMLSWVQDDKINFSLSDRVYCAMIDCLNSDGAGLIVTTISVKDTSDIDVLIRKENFQKILSGYTQRLLVEEKYEKLSEIKKQIQKYGLEI